MGTVCTQGASNLPELMSLEACSVKKPVGRVTGNLLIFFTNLFQRRARGGMCAGWL